jgi:hypothetical protein
MLLFVSSSFRQTSQPAVYNSGGHPIKAITLDKFIEISHKVGEEFPLSGSIWKPNTCTTKNQTWYTANVILFHLLPGLLIDGLLKLSGRKPTYENIPCIIYVIFYILLIMLYIPNAVTTKFQMK